LSRYYIMRYAYLGIIKNNYSYYFAIKRGADKVITHTVIKNNHININVFFWNFYLNFVSAMLEIAPRFWTENELINRI